MRAAAIGPVIGSGGVNNQGWHCLRAYVDSNVCWQDIPVQTPVSLHMC
jgi:hypothetical protein